MAKYLSETGLQTVWSRIDSLFLRKASVDTVPTSGSTNLITSGGMYSVLEELEDTVAASENSLNTRLLAIEGMNLVTGTGLTADKLVLGNGNSTVKTSSKEITTTAPSSSSDDTTIPTSAAVNSAISSALGVVAGALKYKGTVASNSALPANHSVGDVYVVSTAGTFVGKACEVGDYIVCNTSGTAANNAHWDVLNGENQVSNASASLAAAGSSATIATVDGTDITVTTPSTWTGLTKTGTITKVGNTASGDVAVSSSNSTAAFGNAVTVGTVGGVDLKFTMPANPNSDTKVTQTPTTSSNSSWRPLILGSSYSDAATFAPAAATDITYSTHLAKFKPSTGVLGVVGLNKMTTSGTVTTGSDTTVWNTNGGTVSLSGYATSGHTHTTTIAADSGTNQLTLAANTKYKLTAGGSTFIFTTPAHQSLSGYVKLDAGAAEQTIKSSISSMSKGVVNLWRSSGDHYTFLGFSNGTTETALGGIGYKAQNDHNLYKKDGSNYYKIWDENNYTTWINTTNFPGINKTGTVTSVTLTQGTGITVSDSGTAITGSGSRTISLASGVATAGTYRSVTVDTYGRVTSGTNPTTLSGYGITDAKIASGVITLGSNTITPLTSHQTLTNHAKLADTSTAGQALVSKSGGYEWKTLGSNAYNSTAFLSSHQSLGLITASSATGTTENTTDSTNTTTFVNLLGGGSLKDSIKITGSTNVSVKSNGGVITITGPSLSSYLTSSSTLDATKLSGTIPTSCYTDTNTDIRFADYFGESTSTAATTAKTTTNNSKSLESGDLVTGLSAIIYHQYANNASGVTTITLNVGGSGAKAMYNAAGTSRISGSAAAWAAGDIIRWVYDASLNSNAGGWKLSAILGNGSSHKLRLLTGRTPLYSYTETYQGTVTSVTPGTGLRNGTATTAITSSGTLNLISATTGELGGIKAAAVRTTTPTITTGGTTTGRYYGVELDANGKAFVNVPWTAGTSDAVTGVQLRCRNGGAYDVLKDADGNAITYTPTNGTVQIGAIPLYREDAEWGDYIWRWEGTKTENGVTTTFRSGCIWKNGEQVLYGNTHIANTLAFWQAGTHQLDTEAHYLNTGTIGASFYANNNGGGDANSSAFFINVMTAAGNWNTHQIFRFTKDGLYTYPASGRTGITGWFLNESDALTNSEIDTILANA